MSAEERLRAVCEALGFARVGIARAGEITEDHARYRAFIARGMHGEMSWLADHVEVRGRTDTPEILADAKSVIVCAMGYARADEVDGGVGPDGAFIARYARGADYHNFFRKRLRKLATWIRDTVPGSDARAIVDTAPILERAWAQRAGIGFVGKNGCLIVPGLGSYVLLGEVITTVALTPGDPMASRCGACTLCLDACPTRAFDAPYVLDARRCVSYLTIELRGAIPTALREPIGERLFGCDVCQEVCPYNRTGLPPDEQTAPFAADPRWRNTTLEEIARLDDAAFHTLTRGTPLSRPHRAGLVRNALVVIANRAERRHLPVVRDIAARDPDPMVRETATWAAERIESVTDRK